MDFSINQYRILLKSLNSKDYKFQTFSEFIKDPKEKAIILRHDVDLLPLNSLRFAKIQNEIGIKGTYYFRAVPESWDENVIAEISVLDTGIGISDDMIKRILKSTDSYTTLGTDKEQGSGLGINICMDFLNRHGQKLFIENNKKKEGSTFKFYLPVKSSL